MVFFKDFLVGILKQLNGVLKDFLVGIVKPLNGVLKYFLLGILKQLNGVSFNSSRYTKTIKWCF